eukprot:s7596_g3.t2
MRGRACDRLLEYKHAVEVDGSGGCPMPLTELKEPLVLKGALRQEHSLGVTWLKQTLQVSIPSRSRSDYRTPRSSLISSAVFHGTWWAKVGDHLVHAPSTDSGLSSNVGDYYYAYGSHGALTDELHEKRVGGAGRLHIFHLPEGKDSLATQLPKVAGRRDSVSALVQLNHQDVLSDARLFPAYNVPQDYSSGLSSAGERVEKQAVDSITPSSAMRQLKELVALGDGSTQTRTYSNPTASANSVSFLEKKFKEMGYSVCKQQFGEQTSVVASLQGSDAGAGSVTLGGHYDSRPFEGLAPGAVDNGSGAAAVLTIAKALADAKACGEWRKRCVHLPEEALDWDERECDLWFYTDGDFHPREPTAGNWQYCRGKESQPGRVSVITVTTGERHRFHELLFWNFQCQVWDDKDLIVVETYEDEPSSFLSGKAAWNSNMKVISLQRLPGDDLSIGVKRRKSCESFGNAEDCDV